MKAPLYNLDGETVGEIELSDEIFGHKWNADLIRQALLAQAANRRQPIAHARTRSEVRGGGKKPWRQKGTGRARHGSIRSPIWKGGGVTHGPRNEKDYSKKLNRKMKKVAIHVALSRKLKDGELRIVEELTIDPPKTKILAAKIKDNKSSLLVASRGNTLVARASRNIPKVKSIPAGLVNVEDVLKYGRVLVERDAINEIT